MNIDSYIQMLMLFVAVIAIICTQINERRQSKLMLFAEYTRRYQDIFLNMPDDIYDGSATINSRTKRYMRLYFDLCSEEFQLWKQGVIPNNIWRLWEEGMQTATKHQIYKKAWDAIRTDYDKPFLEYFEREIINNEAT